MKMSIAMASHNGARYLKEQLESFTTQTRLPDELVVCDDASSDDTIDILLKFAQTSPFNVKVVSNPQKLGYTANFAKALSLCSGDLICLSDQDDVWFTNKLEVVENCFKNSQNTMVVINNQELVDQSLNPSGLTSLSNVRALGFDNSWFANGCCTTIRSAFREVLTPFPNHHLAAHDASIHRVALAFGVRKIIRETLQYYRRHGASTSQSMSGRLVRPNRLTPLREYGLKDPSAGWLTEIELSEYLQRRLETKISVLNELSLLDQFIL